MKRYNLLVIFSIVVLSISLNAQNDNSSFIADSTGLPGDNFSLQGALEMFKKAATLEEFEKQLNSEDNAVNNLDLNEDGKIDYIRVVDNMDKDVHAIVLQVPVNEKESQDVAVIEIEKNGNESAILQITGDEDLYPENTIVEPVDEKASPSEKSTRKGPGIDFNTTGVVFNVWFWPCIRYVYAPRYVIWVSPWRWNYYPGWFRPWHPHTWRWHHTHWAPYHVHYNVVHQHRVVAAHTFYGPRRTSSVVVNTRTRTIRETHVVKKENYSPRHQRAVERNNNRMERQNPRNEGLKNNKQSENKREMKRSGNHSNEKPAKMKKARRGG